MSEVRTDLLRSRLNLDRPPKIQRADLLRAWLCCDGASTGVPTNVMSLNISSLADNGPGQYGYFYTIPFTGGSPYSVPTLSGQAFHTWSTGWTTSSGTVQLNNSAHTPQDLWWNLHTCGVVAP